jgi:hypothetical protein
MPKIAPVVMSLIGLTLFRRDALCCARSCAGPQGCSTSFSRFMVDPATGRHRNHSGGGRGVAAGLTIPFVVMAVAAPFVGSRARLWIC